MSRRIKLWALICFLGGVVILSVVPEHLDAVRAAAAGRSHASTSGAGLQQPSAAAAPDDCRDVASLALPSSFLPARMPAFQEQLARFLQCRQYTMLDWAEDKSVRDPGPFV